ncbi:ribonuclease D [Amphritea pacifica]|uniref:Ribonuclease D n=1 Tax=Amphritea pacifica TaxID=2811233 RepID=A0ABS2WDH6_9GAMM|nr:ribonuclease D [Amphritea pacifica]MBN0989422.1 ribonuclease D [Amphritea pacifica]MBN1006922.1 ribonuclease D [Amphritea pacifica]
MTQAYNWQRLETAAAEPVWITDDETLADYCKQWQTLPLIALDTEFIRVDTFYPVPGLIQIADDTGCYLIDPLKIENYAPLVQLFRNPSVLKVLHAGNEDLELFLYMLGELPQPIFDTQIAAGFLGWGFSMGYQRLVEYALDVKLDKGETTSDWLQRPLSASQQLYAALDVAYLPVLCQRQIAELESRGMRQWVEEETALLLQQTPDSDPDGVTYYQRFSQAWKLPPEKIAALRDLTAWRERISRQRDVPRNRVLRNHALLDIVHKWPTDLRALGKVEDIRTQQVKQDGEVILGFLKTAAQSAVAKPPEPIQQPLSYKWNKPLKQLKAMARSKAEELNIAPEILLRKKDLDALIRTENQGKFSLPPSLSGWRKAVIGDALLEKLQSLEV